MSWTYENIILSEVAPAAKELPAPEQAAQRVNSEPLSADEMQKVAQQINEYSASPSIQGEISKLASAHQNNPEYLASLVRELSDAIDAVKADPHRVYNVSPEIKQAVEQIREVEAQKPDPLNLLRNGGENLAAFSGAASKEAEPTLTLGSLIAPTAEPQPAFGQPDIKFDKDMGPTSLAIALAGLEGGFKPSNVPDVRAALGIERGGRSA